jgi:hypothetical protein
MSCFRTPCFKCSSPETETMTSVQTYGARKSPTSFDGKYPPSHSYPASPFILRRSTRHTFIHSSTMSSYYIPVPSAESHDEEQDREKREHRNRPYRFAFIQSLTRRNQLWLNLWLLLNTTFSIVLLFIAWSLLSRAREAGYRPIPAYCEYFARLYIRGLLTSSLSSRA